MGEWWTKAVGEIPRVLEIVISAWLVSGIAAAMIACNKGLNGCSWLAMGLLFGPSR